MAVFVKSCKNNSILDKRLSQKNIKIFTKNNTFGFSYAIEFE